VRKIQGLYTIADNTFSPQWSPAALAEQFLKGGARIVQLRMKQNREGMLKAAQQIASFKDRYDFTFIINDWLEVAVQVGADGVHVGATDMSVEAIKAMAPQLLVGYSAHSLPEAVAAAEKGADYVAFGGIFPTKTKGPGHPVQGVDKLRDVVQAVRVSVVAIGGITRHNIDAVIQTGVASVAMITALTQSANITEETQWFQRRF